MRDVERGDQSRYFGKSGSELEGADIWSPASCASNVWIFALPFSVSALMRDSLLLPFSLSHVASHIFFFLLSLSSLYSRLNPISLHQHTHTCHSEGVQSVWTVRKLNYYPLVLLSCRTTQLLRFFAASISLDPESVDAKDRSIIPSFLLLRQRE